MFDLNLCNPELLHGIDEKRPLSAQPIQAQTFLIPHEVKLGVFLFLYPHSVIQETMLQVLITAEIEVALVSDHKKALRVIGKYPDSVLLVNIDEGLSEEEWERYITQIMKLDATKNVKIGVLTYNENADLAQKYLINIGVQCGYIVLKLGLKESAAILLKTLEAN